MASSKTSAQVSCVTCSKGKGIFRCEGCSQIFCSKHSIGHRNDLNNQLEGIEITYDTIQQTLIQQTEDPRQHPLLKKVDQWEKESIEKIRQAAEKARNELLTRTTQYTAIVKEKLKHLSNELRQARDDDDFIETDIRQWSQKLEELQKEILNTTTIALCDTSTSLVSNIRIDHQMTSDIFERICGDARTEEGGRVAVKIDFTGHTEIRGKNDYNTGRHILRFRIEQLTRGRWIFFGIISKSEPMIVNSLSSPSNYGWANCNQIYSGGSVGSGQTLEIIEKDTITLIIDCSQQKIELKNERLNRVQELSIDLKKCSFPWQFHINLHQANTRVRILDSID